MRFNCAKKEKVNRNYKVCDSSSGRVLECVLKWLEKKHSVTVSGSKCVVNHSITHSCVRNKRTKRHAKDSGSAEEERVVKLIIQKYSSSGSSCLGNR